MHQGVDKSRFGHTLGGSIGTDGFLGCAAYARVKPLPFVVWSRVGVQVRSFADSLGRHLRRPRETRRDPSSPIHRLGRWG